MRRPIFVCAVVLAAIWAMGASAADVEAGKTKVAQLCSECHRPADWSGETEAALQSLIKDIVSGKVRHSKRALNLSDQDIADIAAYWTSGRK